MKEHKKIYNQLEFTDGPAKYLIILIIGIIFGFAISIMTF